MAIALRGLMIGGNLFPTWFITLTSTLRVPRDENAAVTGAGAETQRDSGGIGLFSATIR